MHANPELPAKGPYPASVAGNSGTKGPGSQEKKPVFLLNYLARATGIAVPLFVVYATLPKLPLGTGMLVENGTFHNIIFFAD